MKYELLFVSRSCNQTGLSFLVLPETFLAFIFEMLRDSATVTPSSFVHTEKPGEIREVSRLLE
jgi:hypothetical protein